MKIREIGLRLCGFCKTKTLANLDKLHLERGEQRAVQLEKASFKDYLRLGKHKLTGFVVLTALSGYSLGLDSVVSSSNWPLRLTSLVIGTSLCSASAASINQLLEIPYDFQMPRTRNRPLTCHKISLTKSFAFSLTTALTGIGTLALGTNCITASLGASNLILYSFVYTPLKRISPWNTWIGAIVGAIPPLMGWTAHSSRSIGLNSLLLPALLYCWQFPHFFALSWRLRKEYSRAGFEMLSVLQMEKSTLVALRYSLMIPVITSLFYWKQVGSEISSCSIDFGFRNDLECMEVSLET